MSIDPADLFLMRLNVLTNIAVRVSDALWWGSLAMLISGVAVWISGAAALKVASTAALVWRWCERLRPSQVIALFVMGLAMFAYFAGVYALAQRH